MVKNCFYLLIEIRIPVRNIRPPPFPIFPSLEFFFGPDFKHSSSFPSPPEMGGGGGVKCKTPLLIK